MPLKSRLIDLFGSDKPRRRLFVTQDGTTIARDEAIPGEAVNCSKLAISPSNALDRRPGPSLASVTFDGAVQPRDRGR